MRKTPRHRVNDVRRKGAWSHGGEREMGIFGLEPRHYCAVPRSGSRRLKTENERRAGRVEAFSKRKEIALMRDEQAILKPC